MRVWIDMTAPAHVLVFRPLIGLLRARGDEVEITARDYAQTVELLDAPRARGRAARAARRPVAAREDSARWPRASARSARWAKRRRFDVALAHGSHHLTLAARSLGIPSATTFDYEFALVQHQLGCRAATKVVVPEAIPPERLERYGVRRRSCAATRA